MQVQANATEARLHLQSGNKISNIHLGLRAFDRGTSYEQNGGLERRLRGYLGESR